MLKRSPDHKRGGAPGWMVTYADLMTLLLCFFVLLFSFAKVDAERFEQLAGELAKAFGVQREVPADRIPLGTSVVPDRFAPGKPEPTPLDEVRQRAEREALERRLAQLRGMIDEALRHTLTQGRARVEQVGSNIRIRIEEKGTFPSGSASVTSGFASLLERLSGPLAEMPGEIVIDGHTDDVPIRSRRFHSNWDLSATRAAAVANVLLRNPELEASRLVVRGHADTRARVPNDTPEHRARNRRVEIMLRLGEEAAGDAAEETRRVLPDAAPSAPA